MGSVSDLHPFLFRKLEEKYGDKIKLVFPKNLVQRRFHDFARNMIVEDFLATDCDILWFLDSDVVPPDNVLDLITEHGDSWDAAGAPYPVFMTPGSYKNPQVVMCVYTAGAKGLHAASCPQDGVAFVDGLATGCMFLKRSVLEALSQPYFEFKYDEKSKQMVEGEDLGFCRKVNELGYKFLTDYSLVCKHYKLVDLLEVNNYAIEYANTSVLNYDAFLKPQVESLAQKYKEVVAQLKKAQSGKSASGLILPT